MQESPTRGSSMSAQWAAMAEPSTLPLGSRVKQLRQEGWSQADLAAKVGAEAGQISRYENGHMTPSAPAVVRLAEVLDVTTDYLLVEASPRQPLHAPEHSLGDHLALVAELDPAEREILTGVIDALLTKSRLRAITGEGA